MQMRGRGEVPGLLSRRGRGLAVAVVAALVVAACGKKTETPRSPTACTADGDCVFSCISGREDCCPMPCGCTIPMHKADKDAAEAESRDFCTEKERAKCPVVGGCGPARSPGELRCTAGKCTAVAVAPPG